MDLREGANIASRPPTISKSSPLTKILLGKHFFYKQFCTNLQKTIPLEKSSNIRLFYYQHFTRNTFLHYFLKKRSNQQKKITFQLLFDFKQLLFYDLPQKMPLITLKLQFLDL